MEYSIDRFEENIAVLIDENEAIQHISKELLPQEAKEGDILLFDGETYQLDKDATTARKEEVCSLIDQLFQ